MDKKNLKKITKYNEEIFVSNTGHGYRSVNDKLVALTEYNNQGYHQVNIGKPKKKSIGMHRLVWEAYVGEIPENYQIDHIDFDRANNNLSNLRCITKSENSGRHSDEFWKKIKRPVYMIDQETDEIIMRFDSISDAASYAGISPKSIWKVCQKLQTLAGDCKWQYATK